MFDFESMIPNHIKDALKNFGEQLRKDVDEVKAELKRVRELLERAESRAVGKVETAVETVAQDAKAASATVKEQL